MSAQRGIALNLVCVAALVLTAPYASVRLPGRLDSAVQTLRSWIDLGRYQEAEKAAEELVSELRSKQAAETVEAAAATDLLVEALVRNGRGAEARTRAIAEQIVRTKETARGGSAEPLADSLRNLGDVLMQAGEYQAAIPVFERGVAVRELWLGRHHVEVGNDLDHLARVLTLMERYGEALAINERALRIKERALQRTDVRLAATLEARGFLLQRTGDYIRARGDLERALVLREDAGPRHPEIAVTLNLLGEQLWLEGDLVRSKETSSRALTIAEGSLRSGHPEIASYLRSLAVPVSDLGDLTSARLLRERALAIAEKSLGPDHPLVAVQLNDLANSLLLQGDYAAARPLYERAQRAYERRLGPDHSTVTTVVYNLAHLSASLGDFLEAQRQFNRAITTWERVVGRDHPFVARALSALAEMLTEQGRDVEARELYERALTIRERTLGPHHRDVARTLASLATSLARLGQLRDAQDLSTRALGIWERSGAPDTAGWAEALLIHAKVQADQADYVHARESYERALDIRLRILGSSHPAVAETQLALATVLADMGSRQEALEKAIRAEEIGRAHLRLVLGYLPEREALGYSAKRPRGLDLALSMEPDAQTSDLLLDSLIRGRALTLDEMAARRRAVAEQVSGDTMALWTSLTAARQRLANLIVRGPSERGSKQYPALVDEARREKEFAERVLAEKSARFRTELARAEIGVHDVREGFQPGSALVSFVRYDRTIIPKSLSGIRSAQSTGVSPPRTIPSYLAFVLRSGQPHPTLVPLGNAEAIETLITKWRKEIVTGRTGPASSLALSERSLRATGAELRRRIWDPIATHLQDVSLVFVVPDGALNLVPLAALPMGTTSYLLDGPQVLHYLSAERDLVSAPESVDTGRGLLALGGPAFQDGPMAVAPSKTTDFQRGPPGEDLARTSTVPAVTASSLPTARSTCGSFQTLKFEALPGSQLEVLQVANLWKEYGPEQATKNRSLQVLTEHNATEESFKRRSPGNRVLHLATHGFFLGSSCMLPPDNTRGVGGLAASVKGTLSTTNENPLLLSGLALAGANRRADAGPDEEDGILTAEEVSSLDLKGVEWAVLSACDTGLGEVKVGEGVLGLRRAFHIAGARTVIMSLWSVEDEAARQWMRSLYRNRLEKRLNTADAMRQASVSILQARRAKGQSTHPFYWAGFVAAGDWR